jgi:hypothetical protein
MIGRLRGLFFGTDRRNRGYRLENPRPKPRYENDTYTGDMERDGYELLSRADPERMGRPPHVAGTEGDNYPGPDQSFER